MNLSTSSCALSASDRFRWSLSSGLGHEGVGSGDGRGREGVESGEGRGREGVGSGDGRGPSLRKILHSKLCIL